MDAGSGERSRHYEGWPVVAACAIAVFFVSIFFLTFPVFLKPLTNEFSWSREAISAAYAAMTLASALSAPAIGFLVDRWGPRRICAGCLTLAGCAFASLGMLPNRLWLWYATFALIGAASAGTSSVVYSRVICSWFDVMLIGFGTGGEIDVVPYLLSRYFGLPALSTLFGIAWLAFGLAGAVGPIALGRAHDATGSCEVVLVSMAVGTLAIAALLLSLPSCHRRAGAESADPV